MIEWYSSPALRRRCQAGLNKGEAAHKLKRAVFFHERGEIRDRSFESQAFRASGLNLVVSAIVHWNTVYLSRAVAHLRQSGRNIPDALLKHVSPLSWEHINLTGIYSWDDDQQTPEGFRPLRLSDEFCAPHDVHTLFGLTVRFRVVPVLSPTLDTISKLGGNPRSFGSHTNRYRHRACL